MRGFVGHLASWRCTACFIVLLCAVQGAVLLRQIGRPGLYHDEVLFVNAAVGGVGDEFVAIRVGGVPVMLMHYIGALKAWIWSPILAIWEVSESSVRVPAIAIGLVGNVLTCLAMGVWFGRTAAIVTASVICFDPTVGMQSRLDWGPNAIMYLCRGGLLLSVALAVTGRTRRGLVGMAAFVLAGCFDKLSFLWIAVPAMVAFAIIERSLLCRLFAQRRTALVVWASAVALVIGVALVVGVLLPLRPEQAPLLERPAQAARLLWSAVGGEGAISAVYWGSSGRYDVQATLLVGALLLAAVLGFSAARAQDRRWKRAWRWLISLLVMVVLMFTATRSAVGPHHAAVIGGLWQLPLVPPIAAGLVRARRLAQSSKMGARSRVSFATQCGLVALVSATCLLMTWQRVSALSAPPVNPNWDRANWRLAEFIASSTAGPVVFTDWGMSNQSIAVTRGRSGRLVDAWPSFHSEIGAVEGLRHHGTWSLYCLRMPAFEAMHGNRTRFLGAASDLRLVPLRVAVFANETGAEMIEVVRLLPADDPQAGSR